MLLFVFTIHKKFTQFYMKIYNIYHIMIFFFIKLFEKKIELVM